MKKQYIIVGDNNFWYDSFFAKNQQEIDKQVEFVKKTLSENGYEDNSNPNELIIYEVIGEKTTISLNEN